MIRRLTAVIVALSVVVAACGDSGTARLGRVGDRSIGLSDVRGLFEVDTLPFDDAFRATLFRVLANEVITQAAATELGVIVDPAATEAQYQVFVTQVESSGQTINEAYEGLGIFGAGEGMMRFDAGFVALRDGIIDGLLNDEAIIQEIVGDPFSRTTVCGSHILVGTIELALEMIELLESGEDFALIAEEVSLDRTPGGDLGCSPASRYVVPFAEATLTAPIGELFGPVETEFGFHIMIINERNAADEAAVRADPTAFVDPGFGDQLWNAWFNDALNTADVEVVERYGVWTPSAVLPPGP